MANEKERVLAVTVKSKEPEKGGWTLECDIPALGSQYPTRLTGITGVTAEKLESGQAYNLKLRRGNLRKGKDGSKEWHYYWDFVEIAEGTPQEIARSGYDEHERRMDRRTALMQAVELAKQIDMGSEKLSGAVLKVADAFAAWFREKEGE